VDQPDAPEENYPELISLAVHELRTPASIVGGYLRMLQRDADPALSERQRHMVDEAEKSCSRLVALVAELSDLAKLDAGRSTMTEDSFDLFPVIAEVAGTVHEAADRDVRLDVRGTPAGAPLVGDLNRLRAAFGAFFRAALREQAAPGIVAAERRLTTGVGRRNADIIIAELRSVEQVYGSAAATFNERRGGMGLVLPIARRVIERHGGRVWSPTGPDGAALRGALVVSLPLRD